jgi:polyisoprenoid-binding protein YceI
MDLRLSLVLFLMGSANVSSAADFAVDKKASTMIIHVGKTGMFAAFGHLHDVRATPSDASLRFDPQAMTEASLTISFATAGLVVIPDQEPKGDAPKVQEVMLGPTCLDANKYKSITFRSSKIVAKPRGESAWNVTLSGELDLHGVKKAITFPLDLTLQGNKLTAKGGLRIKQTDFGITPVSAGGGTVKVADELDLQFDIVASQVEAADGPH